jgi:hypothetical protein
VNLFDQMRERRSGLRKAGRIDRRMNHRLEFIGEDAGPSAPTGPLGEQGIYASKRPIQADETIQRCSADAELPSHIGHVAGREASTMTPQQLSDGLVPPISLCPDRCSTPFWLLSRSCSIPFPEQHRSGAADQAIAPRQIRLTRVVLSAGCPGDHEIPRRRREPANLFQSGF